MPVLVALAHRPQTHLGEWCGRWCLAPLAQRPRTYTGGVVWTPVSARLVEKPWAEGGERENPVLRKNTHSPGCGQALAPLPWRATPPCPLSRPCLEGVGELWSLLTSSTPATWRTATETWV